MATVINPKCRRTVCQNPHANCKHTQTGDLYCVKCAKAINDKNLGGVKTLIHIPIFSEMAYVMDTELRSRRICDMVTGAYGGDFDVNLPFDDNGSYEQAMMVKFAVSKTYFIPMNDLPQFQGLFLNDLITAVQLLLSENKNTLPKTGDLLNALSDSVSKVAGPVPAATQPEVPQRGPKVAPGDVPPGL